MMPSGMSLIRLAQLVQDRRIALVTLVMEDHWPSLLCATLLIHVVRIPALWIQGYSVGIPSPLRTPVLPAQLAVVEASQTVCDSVHQTQPGTVDSPILPRTVVFGC